MRAMISWLMLVATAGLLTAAVLQPPAEEKVPLDKLPKGVLDVVKNRFAGAEVVEAVKEVKTFYEVTIKDKGQQIDVTLEGEEIVSIEKMIQAKDLPKVVAKTLEEKYPNATYKIIEEIIKVEKKDERFAYYEVLLTTAEKKAIEVLVNSDGKIIHVEDKSKEVKP